METDEPSTNILEAVNLQAKGENSEKKVETCSPLKVDDVELTNEPPEQESFLKEEVCETDGIKTRNRKSSTRKSVNDADNLPDANIQWTGRWCYVCRKSVKPRCKVHRYYHLQDTTIKTRAEMTLPRRLYLGNSKTRKGKPGNRVKGVFAQKKIKPGTLLGPLEGELVSLPEMKNSETYWLLYDAEKDIECIRTTDDTICNWLMFMKKTVDVKQQNVEVFQQNSDIYFVTIRPIKNNEELLYYFSDSYYDILSSVIDPKFLKKNPHPAVLRGEKNKDEMIMTQRNEETVEEDIEDDWCIDIPENEEESVPMSVPRSEYKIKQKKSKKGSLKIKLKLNSKLMPEEHMEEKRVLKRKRENRDGVVYKDGKDRKARKKLGKVHDDPEFILKPIFIDCNPETEEFPEIHLSDHVNEVKAEFRGGRKHLVISLVTDYIADPASDVMYPTISINELLKLDVPVTSTPERKPRSNKSKKTAGVPQEQVLHDGYYPMWNSGSTVQGPPSTFVNDKYPTVNWGTVSHDVNSAVQSVTSERPTSQGHASIQYPTQRSEQLPHPAMLNQNMPTTVTPSASTGLQNMVAVNMSTSNVEYQQQHQHGHPDLQKHDSSHEQDVAQDTERQQNVPADQPVDSSADKEDVTIEPMNKETESTPTKKSNPGFSVYPTRVDRQESHVVYTYEIPDAWKKLYLCIHCGRLLKTRKFLHEHVTKHTNDAKFLCDLCGKGFKTSNMLYKHTYASHTTNEQRSSRGAICSFCSKWFSDGWKLRRHELTHTGEQFRHICEICNKKFSASYHLKRHILTVHHGYRPYVCPVCSKAFSERKDQKQHVLKVHGMQSAAADLGLSMVKRFQGSEKGSRAEPNHEPEFYDAAQRNERVSGSSHNPLHNMPAEHYAVNSLLSFY